LPVGVLVAMVSSQRRTSTWTPDFSSIFDLHRRPKCRKRLL